jgi:hypothetical protein
MSHELFTVLTRLGKVHELTSDVLRMILSLHKNGNNEMHINENFPCQVSTKSVKGFLRYIEWKVHLWPRVTLTSLRKNMAHNRNYPSTTGSIQYLQPRAHAGSSLADFSTLRVEAIRSSETSIHTRSTRRHIPEDGILHSHGRENLKSYISNIKF